MPRLESTMMNRHAAHPSSATLAAFVDGRLAGKDLGQVVEHLASCQDCFEVVAETAEVQEELEEEAASAEKTADAEDPIRRSSGQDPVPDNVVVHPSAWKRWAPAAALVAAALAVAVIGGWQMGWWFGDPLAVDRLAGRLEGSAVNLAAQAWTDHGWGVPRGPGESIEEKKASFRAGVLTLDLQLALQGGDQERAGEVYRALVEALEQEALDMTVHIRISYRGSGFDALESDQALTDRDFKALASSVAELDHQTADFVDEQHYNLGKWAEAGRLASRAGDADALRAFRAPLEDFLEAELDPEVSNRLRDIQTRLRGDLDEEDLTWLAGAFRSVVGGEGVRLHWEPPAPPTDEEAPSTEPAEG